jgi:quercetin dioxygenase-like cupin family protein
MKTQTQAIVFGPGDGKVIPRPDTNGVVTLKLGREATNGAVTVFETSRARGDAGGPGLHSHPGFDEMFYVLSGEFVFTVGSEEIHAGTGSFVYLPRGIFHGFHGGGKSEDKLLAISVPGGIEDAFEEVAHLPAKAGTDEVSEAFRKHGIDFVPQT